MIARFLVQGNVMRYGIWNNIISNNKTKTKQKVTQFLSGNSANSINNFLIQFQYFNTTNLQQSAGDHMGLTSLSAELEACLLTYNQELKQHQVMLNKNVALGVAFVSINNSVHIRVMQGP
jgi:hypothetical protein